MARLLYLVHRIPYPPNKGDKVRSFNLLKKLAESHEVFLGTFIDDPEDHRHVPALGAWSAGVHVQTLKPRLARLTSLRGLFTGQSLTEVYYRSPALASWVASLVRQERIDAIVVFSSSMAQYGLAHTDVPMLVDFVDVDSAKWTDYAPKHRWPLSWLYAREGRHLLAFERRVAAHARYAFFATRKEADLFMRLAPESRGCVEGVDNGVDTEYFASDDARTSPFAPGEVPLVFTGAMDYWPNVDAVSWFVRETLPALRARWPALRLHIVGRSPAPAVLALAGEGVVVTGTVPDVRPYLQHAAVVVAPLRLARGVQNKILEAMAMARPVVAARACVDALHAHAGREIVSAEGPDDYVREITRLLAEPALAQRLGQAGRARVLDAYAWSVNLKTIDDRIREVLPVSYRDIAPTPVARSARAAV